MESEDQEEVVITAVKDLKKSPTKSVRSSEWSLENSLRQNLCSWSRTSSPDLDPLS